MARPPMDVRVIEPGALDEEARGLWEAWHGATHLATSPFVHPALVTAAAESIGATSVAVIRHRGEVVGFFPFQRDGSRGMPPAGPLNDGDGIVLRPGLRLDVPRLLQACGLRSFAYRHMPAGPSSFSPYHDQVRPTARVALGGGFGQYARDLKGSGSKVLQQAGRKGRKLERELGPMRFDLRVGHPDHLVQRLVEWKVAQIADGGSVLRYPAEEATALLMRLGSAPASVGFESVLSALHAGDTLVALNWSLRSGPLWVASIPTHDLDLSDHSPGLLLHVALLEAVAAIGGVEEIDLGLDINRLKGRLMTHTVPFAKGTAYASTPMRVYRKARTAARVVVRGA